MNGLVSLSLYVYGWSSNEEDEKCIVRNKLKNLLLEYAFYEPID